jgi:WD40 repeat protein
MLMGLEPMRTIVLGPFAFLPMVFSLSSLSSTFFIRQIDISTASVTTIAGGPDDDAIGPTNPTPGIGTNSKFSVPAAVAISPDNSYALVADSGNNLIRYIDLSSDFVTTLAGMITPGHTDGVGINSAFDTPYGVAISPDGRYALTSFATLTSQLSQSSLSRCCWSWSR